MQPVTPDNIVQPGTAPAAGVVLPAGPSSRGCSGQQEMHFALVQGQSYPQLPLDLYIPPDALEVILEQFEGPLDLLLYLLRKQTLDILDVNVSDIVDQYMEYIDLMQS